MKGVRGGVIGLARAVRCEGQQALSSQHPLSTMCQRHPTLCCQGMPGRHPCLQLVWAAAGVTVAVEGASWAGVQGGCLSLCLCLIGHPHRGR